METSNYSRRDFLRGLGVGVVSLVLGDYVHGEFFGDRPNVLFIAIDDLNDWCGFLGGHPDAKTPNLDRLAAESMVFERAYCAAPACMPSRTALMSGLRPSTSGVYTNYDRWETSEALADAVSIGEYYRKNGYHTMTIGKIFHYPLKEEIWNRMWDEDGGQGDYGPFPPVTHFKDVDIVSKDFLQWEPLYGPDDQMPDIRHSQWVIDRLNSVYGKPFFLALGLYRPHLPWTVPKRFFDMFDKDKITLPVVKEDDLDDVPDIGKKLALHSGERDSHHKIITERGLWREMVQAYLASTAFVDYCVGQVLDALAKSPHADNTIVCLWSDHGWHLGEKLHWRKFALWEEATRNLLLFKAPSITTANTKTTTAVSLLDIYPTLIELCGLPRNNRLEGQSLVPLMKHTNMDWRFPAVTTYIRNNHSLRMDRWRYTRYEDGTEELYDHQNDPYEWTNLANDPRFGAVKRDLMRGLPKKNVPHSLQPLRQREMQFTQGQRIDDFDKRFIVFRPFEITATLEAEDHNGVIFTCGTKESGFVLYADHGKLCMEVDQPLKYNYYKKQRLVIKANERLMGGKTKIAVSVSDRWEVVIKADGKELARSKPKELMIVNVSGPVVVGSDQMGMCTGVKYPKKYAGTITDLTLKVLDLV